MPAWDRENRLHGETRRLECCPQSEMTEVKERVVVERLQKSDCANEQPGRLQDTVDFFQSLERLGEVLEDGNRQHHIKDVIAVRQSMCVDEIVCDRTGEIHPVVDVP